MDYVKSIIKNIEVRIKIEGIKLPEQAEKPMPQDYKPELDATTELETHGTMYQELIGEMRWSIKIGGSDIIHEVSMISSYQAATCDGNFHKILHTFYFLKKNPKLTLHFDPHLSIINPTLLIGSTAK